jgi:hypothetical protein
LPLRGILSTVRRLAMVGVLASCGRINFDPTHDGAPRDDARPTDARPSDAGIDSPPLACTAANLPCASTALVMPCGSTCFAACLDTGPQPAGAAQCAAWPGALARIDSTANQNCANNIANDAWIGLVQDPQATTPLDGWRWTVGGAMTYVNWGPSDPDDQDDIEDGTEQCAISSVGTWIDEPCNAAKITLCSRPQ